MIDDNDGGAFFYEEEQKRFYDEIELGKSIEIFRYMWLMAASKKVKKYSKNKCGQLIGRFYKITGKQYRR